MNIDPDQYNHETRTWLNQRFDLYDADGIYIPNQPAYGFSPLAFRLEEYARMFAVLRILNHLPFGSLLDVGCADGYGPALIRHLFRIPSYGVDLSDRAIVRGQEMFDVPGTAANAEKLPFPDNAFDVTICTEVLEHVVHPEAVLSELKRVSRNCVIFSTPRAPDNHAKTMHFKQLDPHEPHAHIHYFTDSDIQAIAGNSSRRIGARTRFFNRLLNRLAWGDSSSRIQRRSYFDFSVNSADLNTVSRQGLQEMLLDRYEKGPGWRRYVLTPYWCGRILAADAALAASCPKSALDHLVIVPCNGEIEYIPARNKQHRILSELLGGFKVALLRRSCP